MPHRILLLLALLAAALPAQPLRPFFGLLHSHSYVCDGSGTPESAFTRARSKNLDFFALTAHNHADAESGGGDRADGILIATNKALYEKDDFVDFVRQGVPTRIKSVRRAAKDASNSSFLALFGQEFSSISKGNHVNVIGAPTVIDAPNGDFRGLLTALASMPGVIVQLNHPDVHQDLFYRGHNNSTKAKMFNDYGFDDYGEDFRELTRAAQPFVRLIEVLSGPAMSKSRNAAHRYFPNEDDYYYYLSQGFQISPSVGHDDHYETWGDTTDARMGVFAQSQAGILDAIRQNRTFATEEATLSVIVNSGDKPMGSSLSANEGDPIPLSVTIANPARPGARYTVEVFHGLIAPQSRAAGLTELRAQDGLEHTETTGNGTIQIDDINADGRPEFYYVRVTADNNARAWTAPLWINHLAAPPVAPATFVWSKRSARKVFHHPWCTSVPLIHEKNRDSGPTPPTGWTQHSCIRDQDDQ